jgi:hypothetical protein
VENTVIFLVKHPMLVSAAFGILAGLCGFNWFRAGMTYCGLRYALADQAREASEALGG